MDRRRFLFDTSALLTLLEDESGADRVEELLRSNEVLVPWTALLEAYYVSQQEKGQLEADRRHALIKGLPAEILWGMDEPTILTAARLKANHRISLGDAMIAAQAVLAEAVLVHKDPEYEALHDDVELESLPYK